MKEKKKTIYDKMIDQYLSVVKVGWKSVLATLKLTITIIFCVVVVVGTGVLELLTKVFYFLLCLVVFIVTLPLWVLGNIILEAEELKAKYGTQ